MEDVEYRGAEPPLVGVLATLLAGIAIGAAAVMLANQQSELGGIKFPRLALAEWRSKLAEVVTAGRDRIVRSVDGSD